MLLAAPGAGEELDHGLADLLQLGAELLQDLGRHALTLTDQPEEDVLGADVVVPELQRLAEAELEDLLGPGGERDVAGRRLLALADDLDHFVTDRGEVDVEALESLGGDALPFVEEAEQDVLGADVIVVQMPRFFLGQNDDPTGSVRETLKHLSLLSLTYATLPPGRSSLPWRRWSGLLVIPSSLVDDLQSLIDIPRIWGSMSRVEERLLEAASADDAYLTKIAQHLLLAGGKRSPSPARPSRRRVRPGRRQPSPGRGRSVRRVDPCRLPVSRRRHRRVRHPTRGPSVNANWSNTVAILAGDFLMARASEVAATHLSQESVRLLAATYAELVEGQTRELQLVGNLDHSIEEYHQVIGGKTASLIRTSARLGALAADASPEVVEALSSWAWEVGMVFQIADDALDLVADEETIGKPAGSDIREGHLHRAGAARRPGPDGDRIRHLLEAPMPYSDEAVEEVIRPRPLRRPCRGVVAGGDQPVEGCHRCPHRRR